MARASSDSRRFLAAGAVAQECERVGHVEPEAFGQHALGLLDQDPAVQRVLQLFGEGVTMADGALLQQADGGDVGQGLGDPAGAVVEGARVGVEEIQGADHVGAQAHGDGVHRREADLGGSDDETRPSAGGGQVGHGHGPAGPETVHARALVGLQLEQLQQPGPLRRSGHHLQGISLVGQEQPGRGDAEQLYASFGQHVQEVDHVEVIDKRVSHLDEHVGQPDLFGHLPSGFTVPVRVRSGSRRHPSICWASAFEPQASGDDLTGHVAQPFAVAVGVRAQADERHGRCPRLGPDACIVAAGANPRIRA
jgi:hypothetical protein